jgi:septum formation protein
MKLILASQSASRRAMLDAAGVPHDAMTPGVDEEAIKAGFRAQGMNARSLADALAEMKAMKVSTRFPADLVLGCDSTVARDDGTMIDKPGSREELREQLMSLRGATHRLTSAAVICQGGSPVWRVVDTAKLVMRDFSDEFLQRYLEAEWPALSGCVGGYRLEGHGAQLFARIDGSHFTILGLPLLPVLDYLRVRGVMPQ